MRKAGCVLFVVRGNSNSERTVETMEKGKRAGRGVRLVALLLALCLTACLPSALADEYAEPKTEDG